MSRFLLLPLCLSLSWSTWAHAEAPPKPTSEQQWLRELRGSTSYREGLSDVRRLVEAAYDEGAIAGASHWDDIHEYYVGLAREKGCKQGLAYAEGPTKACHHVEGGAPELTGEVYDTRMQKAVKVADDTKYPDLVRQVIVLLFDYGFVQGLKHGLRSRSDDIRWRQAYYGACVARANDAKGEQPCSKGSKEWADRVLAKIKKRIEAHGLAAAERPK